MFYVTFTSFINFFLLLLKTLKLLNALLCLKVFMKIMYSLESEGTEVTVTLSCNHTGCQR